ncbi:helix-turn-helix domain-containing protein [Prauserella endophytica]|uniref:Helix-turn-helix transcriptional regulator n=1 Tax=Prauserella endophytica TaxID=1592324 RepID=A0ABY2S2F9_9PSEU|nr:helix-turn-helix transcriptional regulator [Prauserella endophytica]TKG67017.1 helix-turn-helix transcriptional regulator [Prauserella endophytica]
MAKPNGPHIQAARERKKWSRRELATKVGRSYEWVFNLEKEHKNTPREKLYLLADVLDVPITYIERADELREPA